MSEWYYENLHGNGRTVKYPELSQYESAKRRRYFDSIKGQLLDEFNSFTPLVKDVRLVGSSAHDAAEITSDIDILIKLTEEAKLRDYDFIMLGGEYFEELHNQTSLYRIEFWYDK